MMNLMVDRCSNENENEERVNDRGAYVNISKESKESDDSKHLMQLDACKIYCMEDVKVDTN